MLTEESKIIKVGNSAGVMLPADIMKDSTNKFQLNDKVKVELDKSGKKITITKI